MGPAAGSNGSGMYRVEVRTVDPGSYGRTPQGRFENGLSLEVSGKEVEASRAEGVSGRERLTVRNGIASRPGCLQCVRRWELPEHKELHHSETGSSRVPSLLERVQLAGWAVS